MFLLDTSAVLAHWLEEPGAFQVAQILDGRKGYVAAVTWLELRVKWQDLEEGAELLDIYKDAVSGTVDITSKVAESAFLIRSQSKERIPSMDALIAGAALSRGMKLVHRDPHLSAIPTTLLPQVVLPPRASSSADPH